MEYSRNLEYKEEPKYEKLRNKFYNLVCNKLGESFDFVYDWTTESDLKKRKSNVGTGNGIELKTTATKDAEVKSKKKAIDGKIEEVNNSFHNINQTSNNKLNNILIKEEDNDNEVIKMDENNIVNDKVDSRCCTM